MIGAAELRRMRKAFRALPQRDREIFVLVSVGGATYGEAAKCYACSTTQVEQAIAQVLVELIRAAAGERS